MSEVTRMIPVRVVILRALVCITLLFVTSADARPGIILNRGGVSTRQAHYSSSQPGALSKPPIAREHPTASIPHTLHKRMMPGNPSTSFSFWPNKIKLHLAHFAIISSLSPVAAAARTLEQFFASIATRAASEWANLPEKMSFAIEEGSFRLDFNCVGDTIPWTFVKEIADRLWEITAMGATNLFEVVYMNEAQKIAVQVTLSLIEDSGGSSNEPQWREGSVPSVGSGNSR